MALASRLRFAHRIFILGISTLGVVLIAMLLTMGSQATTTVPKTVQSDDFVPVAAVAPNGLSSKRAVPVRSKKSYARPKLKVASKSSTTLTAKWSSKARGTKFEVQLGKQAKFKKPVKARVSKKSHVFRRLKSTSTYGIRVRVVSKSGRALSPWSKTVKRKPMRVAPKPPQPAPKPSQTAPLRVASFNVQKSSQANWPQRRQPVVDTIRSQNVDVVGMQEATTISVAGGIRQFQDIAQLLGKGWALTDLPIKSTGEVRTVYNTNKLSLVSNGHIAIAGSTEFGVERYVTWAIFQQKSTATKFVFLNTHFATGREPERYVHRTDAARQLVALANTFRIQKLPIVIAGDFNSAARRDDPSNGVYQTITKAGYIDPLRSDRVLGSAEKRINADLKTVNGHSQVAPRNAKAHMIDNIFVSPMRVAEWETVAKLDSRDRFIGVIPSDHNMIRATVYLP